MKDWWLNLSLREKQTVTLGSMIVLAFIFYQLIFASLANSVQHLRQQVTKNKTLLSWMQESDQRIQGLEKTLAPRANKTSVSLLSLVQDNVMNTPMAKNMTQLQQADNDSIELRFQQVSFDTLMRWLIDLCHQQPVTVTQMSISPLPKAGIVDATLKLQAV
jgi:general secretion pathway protein M